MEPKISLELLISYLKKQSTPEEISLMQDWLKDSSNAKIFEHISQVWDECGRLPDEIEPKVDAAWQHLTRKHLQQNRPVKKLRPVWMAASSVILLVGIYTFVKMFNVTDIYNAALITAIANDSIINITLPDQSTVSLNRNSQISYRTDFKTDRKLVLKGEAFFEVTPDKEHPFEISSNQTVINVVGTSFNVKQKQGSTEVIVKTGKVTVTEKIKNTSIMLNMGEYAVVNENEGSINKTANFDINGLAWKTEIFEFNEMKLGNVVNFLTDHYKISVKLGDPDLNKLTITASFDHQGLGEVLDAICLTLGLDMKYSSNTYYLKTKK